MGDGWRWVMYQEKASALMHSYFWLIVALYLASYESEGPENHIEKDRWKSLSSGPAPVLLRKDVGLLQVQPPGQSLTHGMLAAASCCVQADHRGAGLCFRASSATENREVPASTLPQEQMGTLFPTADRLTQILRD
eukprot:bmy_15274T0